VQCVYIRSENNFSISQCIQVENSLCELQQHTHIRSPALFPLSFSNDVIARENCLDSNTRGHIKYIFLPVTHNNNTIIQLNKNREGAPSEPQRKCASSSFFSLRAQYSRRDLIFSISLLLITFLFNWLKNSIIASQWWLPLQTWAINLDPGAFIPRHSVRGNQLCT